jgi:isopentenyl diphosphate isomerase/L-lactate dehydrogenase-like FMN-dependent dehydrogenase
MAFTHAEVQELAEKLMPVFAAMQQAGIDEAVRRAARITYTPGTISSVSGADAVVEPDDQPGTYVEATVTHASAHVAGARTLVITDGNGASYLFGVIP